MARYILVDDDSNAAGCLTAIIFWFIITAVLIHFAVYVLEIILGIILFISAVIGAVITIKNYIFGLRDSIIAYAHVSKPYGWIIPAFIYKWFKISWETVKGAWGYNIGDIKKMFGKLGFYRFLSFKKWMYFFSGLSVLLFGSLVSLCIFFFYFCLIAFVIELLLFVFIVVLVILGLIGFGVSVSVSTTNYFSRVSESYFGAATILSKYVTQCGYKEFIQVVKNYCIKSCVYVKDGFSKFNTLPLFSPKKWIRLCSSIMTVAVGILMLLIYATIHILILSILFVFFKIVSLFHI